MQQVEAGTSVTELCHTMGVTEQTYYNWGKKCEGLGVSEIRKLRMLREENRKLMQLVADLSLDEHILQETLLKTLRPARRWMIAREL